MQLAGLAVAQSFHRGDIGTIGLHREGQTGPRGSTIDQDIANTADAVLTTDVGAAEVELVAQEIGQRQTCLDFALIAHAVHRQADLVFGRHRVTSMSLCTVYFLRLLMDELMLPGYWLQSDSARSVS